MCRLKYNNSIKLTIYLSIYKALLDYLYMQYIARQYRYYGFLSNYSLVLYILSWGIFYVLTHFVVKKTMKSQNTFSSQLLFIYHLIYIIPFTSMMYAGYRYSYIIFSILTLGTLVFYTHIFKLPKIDISFGRKDTSNNNTICFAWIMFIAFSFIICFSVIYLSWRHTGFRLSFNMANTYLYRVEAFEYDVSSLWGYIYSWSRMVVPVLLCTAILRKKYFFAIVLFLIKMLGFGYDGMRLDVLITIIAIIVAFVYRNKDCKNLFNGITLAFIVMCILSILEHTMVKIGEIDRVITFRVLFLPNLICSWFTHFLETNPPDFFRQSFLRHFGMVSPYAKEGLDYIISKFGNGYNGRANNGLVSDSVTNFGWIGFALMPLIISVWSSIVDKVSESSHISILLVISIYFAYCLTNNFFMIILFTNGGFILVVLLWIMKKLWKWKLE